MLNDPIWLQMRSDEVEFDRLRRRVLWSMPSGLYVIGSRGYELDPVTGERRSRSNLMTANWVMQVSMTPKQVGISVDIKALTHSLIRSGGVFSINFIQRLDRAVVRQFVKPVPENRVDYDADGSVQTMLDHIVHEGLTRSPILDLSCGYLDCELRQEILLGSHSLFIGEVVDASIGSDGLEILRMQDTRMNYGG